MTEALCPFFSTPVLKLPLFAVAVWSLGPLFDHRIVPPTGMVIENGVKLKSAIVTPESVERRTLAWIRPLSPGPSRRWPAWVASARRSTLREPRSRTRLPGAWLCVRPAWLPRPVRLVGGLLLAAPVEGVTA